MLDAWSLLEEWLCVCVRARACVRAFVRAFVHACVRVVSSRSVVYLIVHEATPDP